MAARNTATFFLLTESCAAGTLSSRVNWKKALRMRFGVFYKALIFCASIMLAPQPGQASQLLYECSFGQKGPKARGWVPEQVFVFHDSETGAVEVVDPIIQYFTGGPIKGEVTAETKKRIGFRWSVRVKDRENNAATMHYRLTYYRNGVDAQISAIPGGFDNTIDGYGECKVSTQ